MDQTLFFSKCLCNFFFTVHTCRSLIDRRTLLINFFDFSLRPKYLTENVRLPEFWDIHLCDYLIISLAFLSKMSYSYRVRIWVKDRRHCRTYVLSFWLGPLRQNLVMTNKNFISILHLSSWKFLYFFREIAHRHTKNIIFCEIGHHKQH